MMALSFPTEYLKITNLVFDTAEATFALSINFRELVLLSHFSFYNKWRCSENEFIDLEISSLEAGGKPSTWFPPGEFAELS